MRQITGSSYHRVNNTYLFLQIELTDVHVRTVLVIRRRANGRGKGELILDIVRPATGRLPMGPKTARADVLLVAALAGVRPFVGVQPLVQLEVNELGEFRGAQVAGVGLLAGMQSQMSLEVGGRAEPLLADLALVRFLACVRVSYTYISSSFETKRSLLCSPYTTYLYGRGDASAGGQAA